MTPPTSRGETSAPPAPRIIAITGFMGAGKTTVARALAARLACASIDLDELITARTGRTPQAIIEQDGEPPFRDIETQTLRDALAPIVPDTAADAAPDSETPRSLPLIIALGGGTWTLARNRKLLDARAALSVWLDAPFDLCWSRINRDPDARHTRPLARSRDDARRLYEERRSLYALASLRLEVTAETDAQNLAAQIANAASAC